MPTIHHTTSFPLSPKLVLTTALTKQKNKKRKILTEFFEPLFVSTSESNEVTLGLTGEFAADAELPPPIQI
jgi:hypothetical protein